MYRVRSAVRQHNKGASINIPLIFVNAFQIVEITGVTIYPELKQFNYDRLEGMVYRRPHVHI